MKTITYNGSSKVIKRIVELLNRKAPLPLDGGGDPDFGTNGQVLTTDGLGATSWTTPSGGDSVEWTQIQASGTKIAEIEINGTSTDVYAPNGGGGGGGHTIVDPSGTSMTQRDGLQFLDAHLADDSVNDRTKVEVVKETTEVAFDALDETDVDNDGFYAFEISGGTVIDASQVAYDDGTVEDALDDAVYGGSMPRSVTRRVVGSGYTTSSGNYVDFMLPMRNKATTITITDIQNGNLYTSNGIVFNPFTVANSSILFRYDDYLVVELRFASTQTSNRVVTAIADITFSLS